MRDIGEGSFLSFAESKHKVIEFEFNALGFDLFMKFFIINTTCSKFFHCMHTWEKQQLNHASNAEGGAK